VAFIIRDGYTKTATRPEKNGIPAVTISFRPCLPERAYEYGQVPATTGKALFVKVRDLLLEHLKDWDIEADVDGQVVKAPIDGKTLAKLPFQVLEWAVDCVLGYSDAEAAKDEKN
jgi:hypothetical protein